MPALRDHKTRDAADLTVMDYPLAQAVEEGFVKEPAVVTQQNFDPSAYSAGQLERIKLMDGVRVQATGPSRWT